MITYPNLGNSGRLGNQLWQIASTLGIADRCNDQASFPPWVYQPYFNMPSTYFDGDPGTPAEEVAYTAYMPPQARPYLQVYHLFQQVEQRVREYFGPSQHAKGLLDQDVRIQELRSFPRPILSVHVRRGDNAYDPETPNKADYHPLRSIEYYEQAILTQMYKYKSKQIAIFSDDIPWCKSVFKHRFPTARIWYFEGGVARPKEHYAEYATAPVLDWIDFFAMTMCDHHVIGNSTYAWWAAFVANSPSPVYNRPWYGPALGMIDESLMFPDHWTCIYNAA